MDKNRLIENQIKLAFKEDLGDGDHSSLACIPSNAVGKAHLLVKDRGILAGVEIAKKVFFQFDPKIKFDLIIEDGTFVKPGDIAFIIEGSSRSILACERLALNIMQRMSGIATATHEYVSKTKGTATRILDTRKTTPNFRVFEKEAVLIGGGFNHRFALYDMIMLKDNHIDYAGGIPQALDKTNKYISDIGKSLKIEIEVRDFAELEIALEHKGFDRIMLDNFTPEEISRALKIINGRFETEASGGITLETIESYAKTGVDFISIGALTHQVKSLDLSLKAI